MKELIDFLNASPLGCLATVKEDGMPNGRPFQFMTEDGGKLYFCTSNTKEVFREIKANPNVCFSVSGPDTSYARIWARAVFTQDPGAKTRAMESSELVKSIYRSPSNPEFEVFYLENGTAFLGDLKGTPPKEFTF